MLIMSQLNDVSHSLAKSLLLPLRWLEQARGRKRLALLAAYCLVIGLMATLIWRATSLNDLPDVGQPFDVKEFTAYRVSESEDAFTLYRKAFAQVSQPPVGDVSALWRLVNSRWSNVDETIKARVINHRSALQLWRQGAERLLAMPIQPGDPATPTVEIEIVNRMVEFSWMALLEGARLEEEGNLAAAWEWYNTVLRASYHMRMHSTSNYAWASYTMYSLAADRIAPWIVNPQVNAMMLRCALEDLQAAARMSRPNSETLKADYLVLMSNIDHPERWINSSNTEVLLQAEFPRLAQLITFLKREPERSKRVARILFTHWLAYADKPPSMRPKMSETQSIGNESSPDFPYYVSSGVKGAAYPLTPHELYLWHRSTLYLKHFTFLYSHSQPTMDVEQRSQSTLIVTLAEQLYLREHGKPPSQAKELVRAGYLKQLPMGYNPEEDGVPPTR
jgi:hypothetical protein